MDKVAIEDDMAGTFLVCVMFGVLLMLRGKIEFGNIYGFGLTGCGGICLLINLLTPKGVYVQLYSTISIMGYCLLPFVLLAGSALFVKLLHPVGLVFGLLTILWSSVTATKFFE